MNAKRTIRRAIIIMFVGALVTATSTALEAQPTTPSAGDIVQSPRSIVSGEVRRADGAPLAGITVMVFRANGALTASAVTDQHGVYTVLNLEPGAYRLRVVLPNDTVALPATVIVPPVSDKTSVVRGPSYVAPNAASPPAPAVALLATVAGNVPTGATTARVFYVTDRVAAPSGAFGAGPAFGCADRNCQLSYGRVALDKVKPRVDPATVTTPLAGMDAFRDELLRAAAAAPGGNVVMYIHGCCTTFGTAVEEAAVVADTMTTGPVIVYSMPMKPNATFGILPIPKNYFYDENEADWSMPHLAALLDDLVKDGMPRVDIVAHSLGNRLLLSALMQFRLAHAVDGKRLGNVVFAAADLDTQRFVEAIPMLRQSAGHVTIYRSNGDAAVRGSESLHQVKRLGRLEGDLFNGQDGFDSIDAATFVCNDTGIGTLVQIGHFYWKLSSYVRADIAAALRGVAVSEPSRQAAFEPADPLGHAWRFKELPRQTKDDCRSTKVKG